MTRNYKIIIENFIFNILNHNINSDLLIKFVDFLLAKNSELNLISRKLTLDEVVNDHVLDCIAGFSYFKPYSSIADLGSGGGFPGILLALIFPEKNITLVEKSPKKYQFLNKIKHLLNLENIAIYNSLVEDFKIDSEVITCRAFKDIETIIDMTKNFFNHGGIYILYKAKLDKIKEELIIAKKKYYLSSSINKLDIIKEKERHIVIIAKKTD